MNIPSEDYLAAIKAGHREVVGKRFCCHVAGYTPGSELHRLVLVRENESGYYPVSEDFFMGTRKEVLNKADELNEKRLNLSRSQTARLVAHSMSERN